MREARQAGLQRGLEFGLIEKIVVRPAEALRQSRCPEIADHAAIRADVDVALCLAHQRAHRFAQSRRLEEPHHLVVDVNRARQRIGRGFALDHQRGEARVTEQVGGERADRAAADDRDLDVRRIVHVRWPSSEKPNSCWMRASRAVCGLVTPHWSLRPGGNVQKSGPRGT